MKVKYKIRHSKELPLDPEHCRPGTKVRFLGMSEAEANSVGFSSWTAHYDAGGIYRIHAKAYQYEHRGGYVVYLVDPNGYHGGFYVPLNCVKRIVSI